MAYIFEMEFEWDDAKSEACYAQRGFDFPHILQAFLDPHRIIRPDRRWNYGETRYQLLGLVAGRLHVVVYTMRGAVIRIISARKANRREVLHYEHNARKG